MNEKQENAGNLLLGMDIGGTKTVIVLARATGEILAESRLEDWASGSWEEDARTLENHAKVLLRGAAVSVNQLHAIGLSVPGPLDPLRGVVIEAPNLRGWHEVPLVETLFRAFGVQVLLENDANAAALAEWQFGGGQGARSMIYLTMSTGIGAGLIFEGRLYRGARFQAGEIGHIPLVDKGRTCHCGLQGCLEAYVGGRALADRIKEDVTAGRAPGILEFAAGDPERIDARIWVEALRRGNRYAARLRDEFLDHLSHALAMLVTSLDPDAIVLGTIIRENPDLFLDDLRERVCGRIWESLRPVRIEAGRLGTRMPAYAALCVAALEPPDLSPPDASRT